MNPEPPSKKVKTKYPKIFQCTGYGDCKMTFTRSEHLARHIRKHTGERPFRCHCNRTFSRLDNLRQHIQTVHANEHHILHASPPPPLTTNKPLPEVKQEYSSPLDDGHRKHRPKPISLEANNITSMQTSLPVSPTSVYYPTTPTMTSTMEPTTPTTPYYYTKQQQQQQQPQQTYPPQPPANPPNPTYYSLRTYPSLAQLSTSSSTTASSTTATSSQYPSTSSFSSPMYASASNTSSWLSNVLCDDPNQQQNRPAMEERPHTWGPSNENRLSQTADEVDVPDRNSLSQLVRITEDAHISSPPPGPDGLPSLSNVFADPNRPQLSGNRSYTKNLILPRPESHTTPQAGYVLPVADQRPPSVNEDQTTTANVGVPSTGTGAKPKYNPSLSKPLPPLPMEAQEQRDGMDVLLQAAGV
jgi:hypothetical protein